jgi:hypothetical protein
MIGRDNKAVNDLAGDSENVGRSAEVACGTEFQQPAEHTHLRLAGEIGHVAKRSRRARSRVSQVLDEPAGSRICDSYLSDPTPTITNGRRITR